MGSFYTEVQNNLAQTIKQMYHQKRHASKSKKLQNYDVQWNYYCPTATHDDNIAHAEWLQAMLNQCHIFQLPPDGQLLQSSSILDQQTEAMNVLPKAHLPFELCWLEWEVSDWKQAELCTRLGVIAWETTLQNALTMLIRHTERFPLQYFSILKKIRGMNFTEENPDQRCMILIPVQVAAYQPKQGNEGGGDDEAGFIFLDNIPYDPDNPEQLRQAQISTPNILILYDMDDPFHPEYTGEVRETLEKTMRIKALNAAMVQGITDQDELDAFVKDSEERTLKKGSPSTTLKMFSIPFGFHTAAFEKTYYDREGFQKMALLYLKAIENEDNGEKIFETHAGFLKEYLAELPKDHPLVEEIEKLMNEPDRLAYWLAMEETLQGSTHSNIWREEEAVLQFLLMLQCRNIDVVRVFSKSQMKKFPPKSRRFKERQVRLVVKLKDKQTKYIYDNPNDAEPKHSVKTHYRRGHIRRLANGETTYVTWTIVNPHLSLPDQKQYAVKA